jgi:polyhydroxyalkanoate synthesis regulator phasin
MDLLSKTRKLVAKLEKDNSEKAKIVLRKIKNAEGAYPQQMYAAQVSYLLNMISGTDQKIGGEAKKRFQELKAQFEQLQNEVKSY